MVLTHDLDFGSILAATHGEKPSVVQIRAKDVCPNVIGTLAVSALRQMAEELEAGAAGHGRPEPNARRVLPRLRR